MSATRPPWDFPRNIASTRILFGLGREHGLSARDCLAGTGLNEAQLAQPERMVEAIQEMQVARNLLRHLGPDIGLGLDAGLRYHPTTFGIWGFALQSSPSAWKAVEVGIRYMRLTCAFCQPATAATADEALLICEDKDVPDDVRDFFVDRDSTMILQLQRDVLPMQLPLTRLELRRPRPTYADRIAALYGHEPVFEQAHNRVGISHELAQWPLPQGDAAALKLCEDECQRLLTARKLQGGLAGRIRDQLMMHSRSMPTMQQVAESMQMSARTLRRRLAQEDVAFETLAEDARRVLAEALLQTTDMRVEDIAERLGYAEPSCFSRAFKRWSGLSPRQFRQANSPF
ncbi:MAG TPA: AraC family transcriptional regulator [Aquabacterium sp.]|uniref:AraC family transcriptional regulator n=1 Tax=Aquabacterium sp. TaxID=1872578 RepID=UPI002E340EAC|nr:AraC family transcriptional regulator [Aquabacterium sp.]HEX5356003.1 AraC family transcriptional regulator [Aquabacterium sp.]